MARSGVLGGFRDWFFKPFKREGKSVWRVFTLCFITAAVFWVFNSLNKTYTTEIDYPISISYDKENYIPVSDLPKKARLEVNGFGWDLLKWSFQFGLEPMIIQPDDYNFGSISMLQFKSEIGESLGQVKLNKILSDSLDVNFDSKISKKLALRIDTSSFSIKDGFILRDSMKVKPDSITLTGPKSILDNFKNKILVKVSDNKRVLDSDLNDEVDLEFKSNPLVNLDRQEVEIFIGIEKIQKETFVLEIEKLNFPDDSVSIVPQQMSLEVQYQKSKIQSISKDSLRASADFQAMNLKDSLIPLKITGLPEGIYQLLLFQDSVQLNN